MWGQVLSDQQRKRGRLWPIEWKQSQSATQVQIWSLWVFVNVPFFSKQSKNPLHHSIIWVFVPEFSTLKTLSFKGSVEYADVPEKIICGWGATKVLWLVLWSDQFVQLSARSRRTDFLITSYWSSFKSSLSISPVRSTIFKTLIKSAQFHISDLKTVKK